MPYAKINASKINKCKIKPRAKLEYSDERPRFKFKSNIFSINFNGLNIINKTNLQTKVDKLNLIPASKNLILLDNKKLSKYIEEKIISKDTKKKRIKSVLSYIELVEMLETVD